MDPKTALVLSGGGARGAYEVGVLQFVREELGASARFDILSGSSVGAINAGFLAATSDRPQSQAQELAKLWLGLKVDTELRYGLSQLLRLPLLVFGRIPFIGDNLTRMALGGSFFDVRHLVGVIHHGIPWDRIESNLEKKCFESLSITATDILSGNGHVFIMKKGELPPWTHDPKSQALKAHIRAEHGLASAAIPFFFPLVGIGGRAYCDGSLRQSTPIGPALRLGADRLFVIRLKMGQGHTTALTAPFKSQPNPGFLFGKMFNALFLDQLDYNLDRLERINKLIEDGREAFGPDFEQRLGKVTINHRGMAWRKIDTFVIGPSRDLGVMAAQVIQDKKFRSSLAWVWRLVMGYLDSGRYEESDLLSYLLFDGRFAEDLIQLGYEDAKENRDHICRFFECAGKE